PLEPRSIEETGLSLSFLADLALKTIYYEGFMPGYRLAELMNLPFNGVVERVVEFLRREKFCEIKGGTGGLAEVSYEYAITDKGSEKARQAMERSQYAGPAPVPIRVYSESVIRQSIQDVLVHEQTVRKALSHLVFNERIIHMVGPAVNSGRSLFLYGPTGNGKTSIAEAIGNVMLKGDIYVPYAVEVDGFVIKVFDYLNHERVEEEEEEEDRVGKPNGLLGRRKGDKRWVKIARPCIIVGGELTLESLDLIFDEVSQFYEAPFQMKANGGMFLIDDFGRQQVRPRDLLNRWIVPLEKRIDYLTLHTGRKIEVPFDELIIFATNLAPRDLVDEAFLRRIRYKIEVGSPSFDQYREIFRRVCKQKGVPYDEQGLSYLLREYYIKTQREARACHPRDIIDEVVDIARYLNVPRLLTKELIDRACEVYFVEL
ncbi:MAG: ATP-binding protein, partial [Anaerolineae bacterium]